MDKASVLFVYLKAFENKIFIKTVVSFLVKAVVNPAQGIKYSHNQ